MKKYKAMLMIRAHYSSYRLTWDRVVHIRQLSVSFQSKNHSNIFLICHLSVFDVSHINPCRQPTWKYTSVSASFLFPWSLSLLSQKIPLRRWESAHENIMSKYSSKEKPDRLRTGGFCAAQSYHALQSKAPYPWRGLPLLSPLNTAAASSPSYLLLLFLPPPPFSF